MSKQDRQKLSILVVLLAVLGLVLVMAYRMNPPATTVTAKAQETKTSANPPAASDARIRLDLVDKNGADGDAGTRSIFEYRQPPPPPPVAVNRGLYPGGSSQPGARGGGLSPGALPPQTPITPPGPPPIPLKYQGYLTLDTPTGGFTAVVADATRHYNVNVGEVLMGRYRILSITDKVVDVEDLAYNRRQSLPLTK